MNEYEIPNNIQAHRTKGKICLGPSGNIQVGYKFMVLISGKKIFQTNWDLIPKPDTVIACVNTLGGDQPKLNTFADRHGRLIGDVETPGVGASSDEGEVE